MGCPYKNLFGPVGTGVHSIRVMNIAIVDVIATILGAMVVSKFGGYPFPQTILVLFIIGIISHRIFCVRSTVDKLLFKY